jgi:hypothetical protein
MSSEVIPGFMLRRDWAAQLKPPKTDWTAKRWQDAGKIVVRYIGKDPYVDIEATIARMRGDDKPKRRRAA